MGDVALTPFVVDQKELKDLYKQFKKEIPSGGINKRDFKELLKGLGVVDVFLQDLIFNTFDYDKDGQIDFKDVTTGLSIIARGDPDEKLECEYLLNYYFEFTSMILCYLKPHVNNTLLFRISGVQIVRFGWQWRYQSRRNVASDRVLLQASGSAD